jgi:teichuronic acid biosynthesis glycosyltransferase TuaG
MTLPSVSVVIPAFNAGKFLEQALDSVFKQSLAPTEIVLVDDCSTEPIDEIAARFQEIANHIRFSFLRLDGNRGQAAARNAGISASSADWIAFLDADDIWKPGHLQSVFDIIKTSNADIGFCPATLFSSDPSFPSGYILGPKSGAEQALEPLALLERCFIIMSSVVIRKSKLLEIGGFNEDPLLRGVEDLDCFLRMLKAGDVFAMAPESTLLYRKHPESATSRLGLLSRQTVLVKSIHIHWPNASELEKRRIVSDALWRAAIELWLAAAPDKWHYLARAIRSSSQSHFRGLRWIFRFIRSIVRGNADGL